MTNDDIRGVARGGLEGAIAPRWNMLAPLSEGEKLFLEFSGGESTPKTAF